MKYIDAERLYKQVDELMARFAFLEKEAEPDTEDLSIFYQGKKKMCSELLNIINSLQQEQTEVDLEKDVESWFFNEIPHKINVENTMYHYFQECAHRYYNLGKFNTRKEK